MICCALHAFGTVTPSSQKWMWHGTKCYSSPFSYLDDIPKPKSGHLTWRLVQHGTHIGKMSWSRTHWNLWISCFFLLLGGWNPRKNLYTQPVDVSKTRWWDQLPNPPLESPLPLELQQVKTWGALPAHCLLNGFQFSLPETISNSPWKLMGWSTTFLLGWPIFGSYVSFISRWFARFSFTANIQLGLPQCLTLMNWSSSVHPKFVGSNMSRGLVVFLKRCGFIVERNNDFTAL